MFVITFLNLFFNDLSHPSCTILFIQHILTTAAIGREGRGVIYYFAKYLHLKSVLSTDLLF